MFGSGFYFKMKDIHNSLTFVFKEKKHLLNYVTLQIAYFETRTDEYPE